MFKEWERGRKEQLRDSIMHSQSEHELWRAKCEGMSNAIKKSVSQGKDVYELEQKYKELSKLEPRIIVAPRLFYEETTAEALAKNLSRGFPVCALWSDEAGIVVGGHSMSQDNMLKTIALLNRLWDGKPYKVDRKTSESFLVEDVRFTTSLMMQPEIFKQFVTKNSKISRHSGFLARCMIVWPVTTIGSRCYKSAPRKFSSVELFQSRIKILLDKILLDGKGKLILSVLQLAPEAKAIWIDFQNEVEKASKGGAEFELLRDVASKAPENAARLAANFHLFENNGGAIISEENMMRAIGVIAWFLGQARAIFATIELPQKNEDAQILLDWFLNNEIKIYSKVDILRCGPNRLRSKQKRDAVLKVLEEHYCIEVNGNKVIVNSKLYGSDRV